MERSEGNKGHAPKAQDRVSIRVSHDESDNTVDIVEEEEEVEEKEDGLAGIVLDCWQS